MTPLIEVDQTTYEKLLFASRLIDTPIGEVVRSLTDRLGEQEPSTAREEAMQEEGSRTEQIGPAESPWVPIHKVFKNHRVEGEFNMRTFEIRILSEPWGGKTFRAPTNAAVAVVNRYSPGRSSSNTNGRTFWTLTEGGGTLRSVMGKR